MRFDAPSFCRPGLYLTSPPCMRTHMHLPHAPVSLVQPPWYVLRYLVETATIAASLDPWIHLLHAALCAGLLP